MRKQVAAIVATVAVLAVSCTGQPAAVKAPANGDLLVTYHSRPRPSGLSFRHPASWKAHHFRYESSFTTAIVYLSNQDLRPPCKFQVTPEVESSRCGQPLKQLAAGGVLVSWWGNGFPGWKFEKAHGKPITVDGNRAKLGIQRPGWCESIGGEVSITVTIERPEARSNWWEVRACIRGPGISRAEDQILDLLDSTKLPRGS